MSVGPERVRITLIVAMSADGKITTRDDAGPRFSSDRDKAHLQVLRAASDAVVLGAGTVANDDPPFDLPPNLRAERRRRGMPETPIRAVISGHGSVSPDARLFHGHETPGLVFTTDEIPPGREQALARVAHIHRCGSDGHVDPHRVIEILNRRYGVRDVLLEGGAEVNFTFLSAGLIDEVFLTISPVLIGGRWVPSAIGGAGLDFADRVPLKLLETRIEGGDVFLHYRVEQRPPAAESETSR